LSKSPSGILTSGSATLQVITNEDATCKYDSVNTNYDSMAKTFELTGETTHTQNLIDLEDGTHNYYVRCKDSKGYIRIRFKSDHNNIVFEVEDDGVGRARAQEILYRQNKDHKSLATAITRERIEVLSKKAKKKITLRIEDLANEKNKPLGTLVAFNIPYKQL